MSDNIKIIYGGPALPQSTSTHLYDELHAVLRKPEYDNLKLSEVVGVLGMIQYDYLKAIRT